MSGYSARRREESFLVGLSGTETLSSKYQSLETFLPLPTKKKKKRKRKKTRIQRIQNNLWKEQFDSRDTRFSPLQTLFPPRFPRRPRTRPIRITEHESKGEGGGERGRAKAVRVPVIAEDSARTPHAADLFEKSVESGTFHPLWEPSNPPSPSFACLSSVHLLFHPHLRAQLGVWPSNASPLPPV